MTGFLLHAFVFLFVIQTLVFGVTKHLCSMILRLFNFNRHPNKFV